ncbi:hypothetical protein SpiGrapes_0353 [Sphaerochaeta pleomorpha str. Grapes]|uniref:Organic solvent tolerance protein OstA n=1 Tax=Sphaerochaeta pleomorpha (strain ATCC BAA-1885 / DSM 22778 / Grapes) TaxID=158190 RepID=G8QVH8_SPHPG|nr:LPS-assembly protein LptD [Sphaerochaeta pleomorpha]AEV28211.1 hypothetical protein SpiGrapes_0353 [Sphaerochaeta pleomorpha str. Grapes]
MKHNREELYRKVFLLALLFMVCSFSVFADIATDTLLMSLSISSATKEELEQMVSIRDLPLGTEEEMRKSLYALYSIEELQLKAPDLTDSPQDYKLTIVHADSAINKVQDASLVVLEGNVTVEFSLADEEKPKTLTANKMILDLANTRLSAFGSVNFIDPSDQSSVQEMTGDIITLNWSTRCLTVSGGTTKTERKNSEDKTVSFFTSGEQITYMGSDNTIFFDEGFITTNKENAYSSITAKSLSLLSGGDILVNNAYLSIGRVPVLWVPVFFFPGSTMVGNPAMGFTSDRGMFVNTTFELYGTYPNIKANSQSSFSSLLAKADTNTKTKEGPLYRDLEENEALGDLETWAQESDSYLVVFADSYEYSGVSLGFETNNTFLQKKASVASNLCLALHPDGYETLISYSDYPVLRYISETKLLLDTSWADLSILIPFYSDPKAKRIYANRLTSFSVDSLFGANQEFPSDFSSDISSFTWIAKGSFKLPVENLSPYVKSLEITTLNASINYSWQTVDGEYGYFINSVMLPELSAKMTGTLFSFSRQIETKKKKTTEAETVTTYERQLSLANKRFFDSEAKFTFAAPVTLEDPYRKVTVASTSETKETDNTQYISLGYTIDEKYYYSLEATEGYISDWESSKEIYNLTKGVLKLDAQAHPDLFSFTQTLTPQVTSKEDRTKTEYLTEGIYVSASTIASIPLLGLTYTLSERLYSYSASYSEGFDAVTKTSSFDFTKDYVTTHQLKFSKSYAIRSGTFSPSVTATLPPLDSIVLPAFSYKTGNWLFFDSFKFKANTAGILEGNLITSSATFTSPVFSSSLTGTYQLSEYEDSKWEPFDATGNATLNLFNKKVSLQEKFKFEAVSSSGDANYFSTLSSTLQVPSITTTLDFTGVYDALKLSTWNTKVVLNDITFAWWKNRIQLKLGLDTSLSVNFLDYYATTFGITAKVGFSIAEFLDFKFSVTSSNTGFYSYYDGDSFSFASMWEDLANSFDFFGDGRNQTQFNMSSVSAELTHYMDDWSLNCKYKGSVVLSDNQYSWVPIVSIFLQWKTIPELKVDENWTETSGIWSSTSAT